jgi:hypothetical protein
VPQLVHLCLVILRHVLCSTVDGHIVAFWFGTGCGLMRELGGEEHMRLLIPGLATFAPSFHFGGTFLFAFCDDEYEIPPLVRIASVIISIFLEEHMSS